jgi:hypothetical protein
VASLFGEFQLRELARNQQIPDIDLKLDTLRSWANDYHHGSLRTDNETAREQAYNHAIFGTVLGYVQKPASPFTFEPKSSTASGQLPDARIGHFDLGDGTDRTVAVVELKGASTSLDRPQRGHSNLSPVQQGFKYRPQYRGCEFVVVSNFYELRLYNDNELDFERWTLDELVDPTDDYLNFRIFYLLLSRDNFVTKAGKTPTQSMLLDIRGKQEEIGRKFYLDYKAARIGLINNLWLLNESVKADRELGIEKAQKIIDRMVFACFAEDRGLLPEKAIARALQEGAASSFGSLWTTFRSFFEAIDRGSDKLGIAVGYNGGLFARDETLDDLVVGDNALRGVANLSNYNFVEDLSVSILGHIFEQSITDLEDIRAERSTDELAASRRKKDGIYYTPDRVVRFMVDRSLGAYLRGAELNLMHEVGLKSTVNDATYSARERTAYLKYQQLLQNVKVLDPSCGSGAFLVQVFDYLLAENSRVGEILGDDVFSDDEFIKLILQQNIYGVDLNEESVEITKLSLWLKSAKKGRQLTTLDANIRCGDSLIESADLAGSHAFRWGEQFANVFSEGGFDVVIGNPPYVDSEIMVRTAPQSRAFLSKTFTSASGNWDLFVPFYQRAFDLTKADGICSMIVPNKILGASYAAALRSYIEDHGHLRSIVDVSREQVFDVDVYPVIITSAHGAGDGMVAIQTGTDVGKVGELVSASANHNWAELFSNAGFEGSNETGSRLSEVFGVFAAATVAEAYELKEVIAEDAAASRLKVLNTGTIDPYWNDWGLWPLTYIKGKYLHPTAAGLQSPKTKSWMSQDKVIVAGMSQSIEACFAKGDEFFPAKSTVVVTRLGHAGPSVLAALALVNSNPFRARFIASNSFNAMAGGYITVSKSNLADVAVPGGFADRAGELEVLAKEVLASAEAVRSLTERLMAIIRSEFGDESWTPRLKNWWTMDFTKFAKALRAEMSLYKKSELALLHQRMASDANVHTATMAVRLEAIDEVIAALYAAPPIQEIGSSSGE